MIIILGIIVGLLIVWAILDLTHLSVFGKWIKEEELDHYLGKYLGKLRPNSFSYDVTLFHGGRSGQRSSTT